MNKLAFVTFILFLHSCDYEEYPEPNDHLRPVAIFSLSMKKCIAPCKISTKNMSQNSVGYIWSINNIYSSTDSIIAYEFDKAGIFDISLTVINNLGSDRIEKQVIVTQPKTFYHKNILDRSGFNPQIEIWDNDEILTLGGQKLLHFGVGGNIKKNIQILDNYFYNFSSIIEGSEILTLGLSEAFICPENNFSETGTKRINIRKIDINGNTLSSPIISCNYNSTFTGLTKLNNSRYAIIGNFKEFIICFSCPPEGGDLIMIDEKGAIVAKNPLESGEITATLSVKSDGESVFVAGGIQSCIDIDCKYRRYDFSIAKYDNNLELVNSTIIQSGANNKFNLLTDFCISDNSEIYAIGQRFQEQIDYDFPLDVCSGFFGKINTVNNSIVWENNSLQEDCIIPVSMDIFNNEIVMAGFSNRFDVNGEIRLVLQKYTSNGDLLFTQSFDGEGYCQVKFDNHGQILLLTRTKSGYDLYKLDSRGTL